MKTAISALNTFRLQWIREQVRIELGAVQAAKFFFDQNIELFPAAKFAPPADGDFFALAPSSSDRDWNLNHNRPLADLDDERRPAASLKSVTEALAGIGPELENGLDRTIARKTADFASGQPEADRVVMNSQFHWLRNCILHAVVSLIARIPSKPFSRKAFPERLRRSGTRNPLGAGAQSPCAKSRGFPTSRWGLCLIFSSLIGVAYAQDAAKFYKQNCAACHSVGGGKRIGPDLKDVTARQSREWLVRFLEDPQAVAASDDVYARKIVAESHGMIMPKIGGVDSARAEELLTFIESESSGGGSQSPNTVPAEASFTASEVARGREIVLGSKPLSNGGPACISCHTLSGLAAPGGGRLGPDLTHCYDRFGGRRNLTAWLTSPATPTMQAVYQAQPLQRDEIVALSAYFEAQSKQPVKARRQSTFVLLGICGSLASLVLLDGVWRGRLRAVRRPLVARRRA